MKEFEEENELKIGAMRGKRGEIEMRLKRRNE